MKKSWGWRYKVTVEMLSSLGTVVAIHIFDTKKEAINYLKHKELFRSKKHDI